MSEMAEAIRQLIHDNGYSEDSVKIIIEDALKAAYKKYYGTDSNAIVLFNDDMSDVSLYSRKTVVEDDDLYDPVAEIELAEAKKLSSECEVGDEIEEEKAVQHPVRHCADDRDDRGDEPGGLC